MSSIGLCYRNTRAFYKKMCIQRRTLTEATFLWHLRRDPSKADIRGWKGGCFVLFHLSYAKGK